MLFPPLLTVLIDNGNTRAALRHLQYQNWGFYVLAFRKQVPRKPQQYLHLLFRPEQALQSHRPSQTGTTGSSPGCLFVSKASSETHPWSMGYENKVSQSIMQQSLWSGFREGEPLHTKQPLLPAPHFPKGNALPTPSSSGNWKDKTTDGTESCKAHPNLETSSPR